MLWIFPITSWNEGRQELPGLRLPLGLYPIDQELYKTPSHTIGTSLGMELSGPGKTRIPMSSWVYEVHTTGFGALEWCLEHRFWTISTDLGT